MRVYLSAGEHSGEKHAATLARALRAQEPGVELIGMGGQAMRAAGVEVLFDPIAASTVGFMEALANLGKYRRLLREVAAVLAERRPDVVVWVDFGGFNLSLAGKCRRLGLPVVCVFSPSAWGYGAKRARLMAERVTELAAVLPFEADFYRSYGIRTTFVGHPLVDQVRPSASAAVLRREFLGEEDARLVALLPGSRHGEIARLLPVMLDAAALLARGQENLRFILPRAPSIPPAAIEALIGKSALPLRVIPGRAHDVIAACDAAMVASGTATLEAALIGAPMVSIYRVSPISFRIYRMLLNPARRGRPLSSALPNLVLGREAVPELLQEHLTPAALAGAVERLLVDREYRRRVADDLAEVRQRLGEPGAMDRVAAIIARVAASSRTVSPAR